MPLSNRFQAMGEYARSHVVRDRNYGGLAAWAASQMQQPIPPNPDDQWIRLRLMAERIPQTPDVYVQKIAPYMLHTPDVTDNICDHLAPYLEDTRADAVHTQIGNALQVAIPMLAAHEILAPMIAQWRVEKGYPNPTTPAPATSA